MRPIALLMENEVVHRAAANADHRRAAGLTFQSDQSESFLYARVNKKISGPVIASQFFRLGAVSDPGNVLASRLQFAQLISLRAIADHQQMKIVRSSPLQNLERAKQSRGVLLLGEPSDVKQKFSIGAHAERCSWCLHVGSVRSEDVDVNAEA